MSAFVFRWRGFLFVPLALVYVMWGKPSVLSFAMGLIFAICGEGLRIWGVGYAGSTTRSSEVRAPSLVTAGPYAYLKNPLYLGNFIIGFGFFFISGGEVSWPLRIFFFAILFLFYGLIYGTIIPLEEKYLAQRFGESYLAYAAAVHRIIPKISPYNPECGDFSWSVIQKSEIHTLVLFALMTLIMYFKITR